MGTNPRRMQIKKDNEKGRGIGTGAQIDSTTKLGRAELPLGRPTGRSALPDSAGRRKPSLDTASRALPCIGDTVKRRPGNGQVPNLEAVTEE
jgi:hypothetical protein